MKSAIRGALVLSVLLAPSHLPAQENQPRTCWISDGGDLLESARCEIIDIGEITEFKGIIDESDVTFTVDANRKAGTARLVGARTFVLADGAATIGPDEISWPNGYSLRIDD